MTSEKSLFKIRSFFTSHTKGFADKVSSKLNDEVKSYSCSNLTPKQYQIHVQIPVPK